jgi:hypothetical protein
MSELVYGLEEEVAVEIQIILQQPALPHIGSESNDTN